MTDKIGWNLIEPEAQADVVMKILKLISVFIKVVNKNTNKSYLKMWESIGC